MIEAESNREAALFASRPELWPSPLACLVGPTGCGKSHIGRERFSGAVALSAELLGGGGPAARLSPAGAAGRFWFDDLDVAHRRARSAGTAQLLETALFHLINELAVGGGRLLISAGEAPAHWPVALPDLRTRLNTALVLWIGPPDDALLGAYLERRLAERGLAAGARVTEFLLARIGRDFASLEAATEALDRAALRERRCVTRDFAARVLGLRPARSAATSSVG